MLESFEASTIWLPSTSFKKISCRLHLGQHPALAIMGVMYRGLAEQDVEYRWNLRSGVVHSQCYGHMMLGAAVM